MSTRAILIKNKLIDIITTLNADGVKACKVYKASTGSSALEQSKTNVFPIEERTRYEYIFEDGGTTRATGESLYLLGGETWINQQTLADNDLAFQRYSLLLDKLEDALIDYQEFTVSTVNGKSWRCSLQLVDSSTDAISNEKRVVFNIRLRIKWVQI